MEDGTCSVSDNIIQNPGCHHWNFIYGWYSLNMSCCKLNGTGVHKSPCSIGRVLGHGSNQKYRHSDAASLYTEVVVSNNASKEIQNTSLMSVLEIRSLRNAVSISRRQLASLFSHKLYQCETVIRNMIDYRATTLIAAVRTVAESSVNKDLINFKVVLSLIRLSAVESRFTSSPMEVAKCKRSFS